MENKRIYPCVRCARSTFERKIAPRLKEWGYKLMNLSSSNSWSNFPYIITNYEGVGGQVTNHSKSYLKRRNDRYICRTIPEFLEAVKALAIERGWFKEEKTKEATWEPHCKIDELPPRLRRLAEYCKNTVKRYGTNFYPNTVFRFTWNKTEEGESFWRDVFLGIVPDNLEEILTKFEKEHSELLELKQAEEVKSFPPTITEARKQFRELTKHYTVEQLSEPELDEKLAALRKLVQERDKWRNGQISEEWGQCWGITSSYRGVKVWACLTYRPCLSFPTKDMAEKFLNTFRDLINTAGDLI